mmetsp:Transcript_3740/g.10332  ORF Transcript_3740/g.10332 Transcript_3740/m.10332 type:complete len:410 (-) Transcript_3740:588-1817(-)
MLCSNLERHSTFRLDGRTRLTLRRMPRKLQHPNRPCILQSVWTHWCGAFRAILPSARSGDEESNVQLKTTQLCWLLYVNYLLRSFLRSTAALRLAFSLAQVKATPWRRRTRPYRTRKNMRSWRSWLLIARQFGIACATCTTTPFAERTLCQAVRRSARTSMCKRACSASTRTWRLLLRGAMEFPLPTHLKRLLLAPVPKAAALAAQWERRRRKLPLLERERKRASGSYALNARAKSWCSTSDNAINLCLAFLTRSAMSRSLGTFLCDLHWRICEDTNCAKSTELSTTSWSTDVAASALRSDRTCARDIPLLMDSTSASKLDSQFRSSIAALSVRSNGSSVSSRTCLLRLCIMAAISLRSRSACGNHNIRVSDNVQNRFSSSQHAASCSCAFKSASKRCHSASSFSSGSA